MVQGTLAVSLHRFVVRCRDLSGVAGFWRRLKGHHLRLPVRFGTNKPVTQHLNFEKWAMALVVARGPAAMQAAINKAIATASR